MLYLPQPYRITISTSCAPWKLEEKIHLCCVLLQVIAVVERLEFLSLIKHWNQFPLVISYNWTQSPKKTSVCPQSGCYLLFCRVSDIALPPSTAQGAPHHQDVPSGQQLEWAAFYPASAIFCSELALSVSLSSQAERAGERVSGLRSGDK